MLETLLKTLLCAVLVVLPVQVGRPALAASDYVLPRPSVAPSARPASNSLLGKRFIIAPLQHARLQYLSGSPFRWYRESDRRSALLAAGEVPPDALAGRLCKVIDVVPKGDHGEQLVVFTAEDVDGKFCVSSYSFSEPLIIDPAIIDRARKEIGGKARWLSAKSVTYINPKTGAYESGYFEKYSKVAVKMVVLCDDPINKLSIIFDTADGKRAFIDVLDDSFLDTIFLPADPKKKYNWPHRAWAAIERGEVYVGMSETQVYFSWGAPDKVNETRTAGMVHHQLVYRRDSSTAYVYTQNERVTAIQE